jgi:hypothetical protein
MTKTRTLGMDLGSEKMVKRVGDNNVSLDLVLVFEDDVYFVERQDHSPKIYMGTDYRAAVNKSKKFLTRGEAHDEFDRSLRVLESQGWSLAEDAQ